MYLGSSCLNGGLLVTMTQHYLYMYHTYLIENVIYYDILSVTWDNGDGPMGTVPNVPINAHCNYKLKHVSVHNSLHVHVHAENSLAIFRTCYT